MMSALENGSQIVNYTNERNQQGPQHKDGYYNTNQRPISQVQKQQKMEK